MENKLKTIVFVLGMHRSGTSSITRVLNLMGAWLPPDLKSPDQFNVRGYWQSNTVLNINEKIFRRLGKGWRHYGDLAVLLSQENLVNECVADTNEFLDSIPESENLVVLKDSSFCRLFPIWDKAVKEKGWNVKVVLPYRHPVEVAYSLNGMEHIDIPGGLLIWLSYVLDSEKHTRNHDRLFVQFQEVLKSDPRELYELISSRLNIELPVEKNNMVLMEKIREYLSVFMIKHKFEDYNSAEFELHPYFAETYNNICSIEGDKGEVLTEIDKIRAAYYVSCDLFFPLIERLHTIIRNLRKN